LRRTAACPAGDAISHPATPDATATGDAAANFQKNPTRTEDRERLDRREPGPSLADEQIA